MVAPSVLNSKYKFYGQGYEVLFEDSYEEVQRLLIERHFVFFDAE